MSFAIQRAHIFYTIRSQQTRERKFYKKTTETFRRFYVILGIL